MGTGFREALCAAIFGGVGDAAGYSAGDGFVVETEGDADLHGYAEGVGDLSGELTV